MSVTEPPQRPARNTEHLGLPVPGDSGAADYVADTGALADAIDALYAALLSQPGDIKPSAAQLPTSGWLLCDGSAISRTVYAALFAAVGTAYGAGDGSTTFNLPNLRGKVPQGAPTPQELGLSGGEATHVLSVNEMPVHAHSVYDPTHAHSIADPGHVHGVGDPGHYHQFYGRGDVSRGTAASFAFVAWGALGSTTTAVGTGVYLGNAGTGIGIYGAATGIGSYNAGASYAHNNLPPYQNVNYFIKT